MGDRLVFILPDGLEELLWAIPVLLQDLVQRVATGRKPEKVTIVCRWEQGHRFLRACWGKGVVVSSLSPEARDEADFVFEFDPDKAYQLTKNLKMHIVEAYALQVGAFAPMRFPPIAESFGTRDGLVLVAKKTWMETNRAESWPEEGRFFEIGRQQEIPMRSLPQEVTWEQLVAEVSRASVVVGLRSAATLLAASMGKLLVELYSNTWHRNWAAKWGSKKYRMFYGELGEMGAEVVWERTQGLLETLRR